MNKSNGFPRLRRTSLPTVPTRSRYNCTYSYVGVLKQALPSILHWLFVCIYGFPQQKIPYSRIFSLNATTCTQRLHGIFWNVWNRHFLFTHTYVFVIPASSQTPHTPLHWFVTRLQQNS